MTKRNLFYFGLEPLKERYTYQLSKQWMPDTFLKYQDKIDFIDIPGEIHSGEIKVGCVLDAVGRSVYSLSQCNNFIKMIGEGKVKDNDIIFLQDFWTPGIEGIFYTLDLYNIKVELYSMLHAQSVDEYDFTHNMSSWMRHYELGLDARSSSIFVGSTIHKEQLRNAGFKAPIHVVSLPFHKTMASEIVKEKFEKKNQVIFTSRLDKEKNPFFLLEVIKLFLCRNENFKFIITTGGTKIKSNLEGAVEALYDYAKEQTRFIIRENITKEEYYSELTSSKTLFNSSLQDYVSWTAIEADNFGCQFVCPNFRSFPDFANEKLMYAPFKVNEAVKCLEASIEAPESNILLAERSDIGRQFEGYIIANNLKGSEYNIWHEYQYIKRLIENE